MNTDRGSHHLHRVDAPHPLAAPPAGAVWTEAGRQLVPGNRWDLARPSGPATTSVVVPYHEAPSDLLRLLASLAAQTRPAEEVIVVDDGSRHAPAEAVLRDHPEVRVLTQVDEGVRPAAARNLGARAASGEVLVFLDTDVVVHPTCLGYLTALPGALPDAMVVGRLRYAVLNDLSPEEAVSFSTQPNLQPQRWLAEPEWLRDGLHHSNDLLDIDAGSWRLVHATALAVAAPLFSDLNGFDESLTGFGGEDWEFAHRALHAGAVLAHEPRAVAIHNGPHPSWHDIDTLSADDYVHLTPLITDRSFRPANMMGQTTRVVAYLDDEGWSDLQRRETVEGLLRVIGDVRIVPTALDDVPTWALGDPRVQVGDPELAHTQVLVSIHRPIRTTEAVHGLLERLDPGGLDHILVTADGQRVATLSAARTVQRLRRASPDPGEREVLWASLAAAELVTTDVAGLTPLEMVSGDDEPALS